MVLAMETDVMQIDRLLAGWLCDRLPEKGRRWLQEKRQAIASGGSDRLFFTAFSAVPRYTGKQPLDLSAEELAAAQRLRPGWFPGHWTIADAGRTLMLLSLPHEDGEQYVRTLARVFSTADVGESVALYQSLPVLPHPEKHRDRAAEGVRTNMTVVFNAIALRNPYPADYFDDLAWNQMVLKAVFVESPLYPIEGLDRRANPELARMLCDYAHERWAAGRSVTPELWRPVGRFADRAMVEDLERAIAAPDIAQQEAAALACAECALPEARSLLDRHPELRSAIAEGRLTWDSFQEGTGNREQRIS